MTQTDPSEFPPSGNPRVSWLNRTLTMRSIVPHGDAHASSERFFSIYAMHDKLSNFDVLELLDDIKGMIIAKCDFALTPEQLKGQASSALNESVLKPILSTLKERGAVATVFCLLYLADKFGTVADVDLGFRSVWTTRSAIAIYLATRCLRYYNDSDLVNALYFDFTFEDDGRFSSPSRLSNDNSASSPLIPGGRLSDNWTGGQPAVASETTSLLTNQETTGTAETFTDSAMALAIKLHAIAFTSHPLVQATTHAIWDGRLSIVWENLGDDEDRPRHRYVMETIRRMATAESSVGNTTNRHGHRRQSSDGDTENGPNVGSDEELWRRDQKIDRNSWAYLSSRRNLLDIAKLRVPRLQYVLSVCSYSTFLFLYSLLTLVVSVNTSRITTLEILADIAAFSLILEEFSQYRRMNLYAFYLAFFALRLIGTILISIFSQSFSSIINNAEAEFEFQLAQLVVEFAKTGDVYPFIPPFNVVAFVVKLLSPFLSPATFARINRRLLRTFMFPLLLLLWCMDLFRWAVAHPGASRSSVPAYSDSESRPASEPFDRPTSPIRGYSSAASLDSPVMFDEKTIPRPASSTTSRRPVLEPLFRLTSGARQVFRGSLSDSVKDASGPSIGKDDVAALQESLVDVLKELRRLTAKVEELEKKSKS
ncbi:hypothetical protein HDU93_001978 [Gonapodya sp. JEL0774]|nr:hypothetical protein HDU93_001978 [Gonapodya sp. JEL0774]